VASDSPGQHRSTTFCGGTSAQQGGDAIPIEKYAYVYADGRPSLLLKEMRDLGGDGRVLLQVPTAFGKLLLAVPQEDNLLR